MHTTRSRWVGDDYPTDWGGATTTRTEGDSVRRYGHGTHTLLRQCSDLGGPVLRLTISAFRWTPGWLRAEW
jgi:hypothetical protein